MGTIGVHGFWQSLVQYNVHDSRTLHQTGNLQCTYSVLPSILCNVPIPLQIVYCSTCTLLSQETDLCTITYVTFALILFQFPPHEPKVETGKDFQAIKTQLERYRQQRNVARSEVKALHEQLEQSKMVEAERGGSVTVQYEKRIQELETVAANADRKHEERIQKLTKEFENVLAQKEMEYRARMRTFGENPSSSVQQMEAIYQNQLQQKEKELRDRERDFAGKRNDYLAQISELKAVRDEATRKEGEARREVERITMEHQLQLQKLQHSQPGVSEQREES